MDPAPAPAAEPPEPQAPPPTLGPVAEQERILALDALRGFALLGIFMVNMNFFAMPFASMIGGEELATAPLAEQLAWGFVFVLFTYKFISLFSLMFGMGLVVTLARAEAAQRPFVPVYLRRLAVLALIGLAHALLFWYGDILFIYAVLGLVLLLCRKLSPKALLGTGAALIALSVVLNLGFTGMMVAGTAFAPEQAEAPAVEEAAPGAHEEPQQGDAARGIEAMLAAGFDMFHPVWIEAETRAYREGPFSDAFAFRAVSFLIALAAAVFSYGWRVLGLFLIGAALMKLSFFGPERRGWHVRLAVWGIGVGLPMQILGAVVIHLGGHDLNLHMMAGGLLHEVGSVGATFGYAGLVALVVSSGLLRSVVRALAGVGRMALSNYLLQTLMATALMYWWGLGWFGQVSRVEQIGLVAILFIAQVVFSALWLRAFRFGPFEWLWRVLTYGRLQPLWR